MRILALDLGTTTGWATDAAGELVAGSEKFARRRDESFGMRYLRFRQWLLELLDLNRPDLVVYEQILPHHRGALAAEVAHKFEVLVQTVLEERGLEYATFSPGKIKRQATGKGNAKKERVIIAARERWAGHEIRDDNQADAMWLLDLAQDTFG